MGTRSLIGKLNGDGSITAIYCHWDGYPEHNGVILREHYNTPAKVGQLINLGDISSLRKHIGKKHPFDSNDDCYADWTKAYGRDRKEKNCKAVEYKDMDEFLKAERWQEYYYLWNGEKWTCYQPNHFVRNGFDTIDLYAHLDEAE